MVGDVRIGVLMCALLAATGCGGGGGGGDDSGGGPVVQPPPPPPPPSTIVDGVFKDASVIGLGFVSGAQQGVTAAGGAFTCESGRDVTFSVGAVVLGTADCATVITPASLTASGELDDVETVNRVRFLLMLDVDGDPTNGIEISAAVQEVAASWAQPDFAAMDLDAELVDIISDAFSVDQTMHDLPDAAAALAHLQGTVGCAYAGAFAGTMSGDLTGSMSVRIGLPGFAGMPVIPDSLDWQGVGQDEFFVGGGGSNSVVYAALPRIVHEGPNLAGPMTGAFIDPDRISGDWESSGNGVAGTFSVTRLGGTSGDFRFVGRYFGGSEGSIGFTLTGDTVSGEAFDIIDGTRFTLTGSVAGDTLSLTATGSGETFTGSGTILRDPNGAPISLDGSWNDGGLLAGACRLN